MQRERLVHARTPSLNGLFHLRNEKDIAQRQAIHDVKHIVLLQPLGKKDFEGVLVDPCLGERACCLCPTIVK